MSIWLAVGDETGDWDRIDHPGAFVGVGLLLGQIEDWQAALGESVAGRAASERLGSPPQHLPSAASTSRQHHLLDILKYWRRRMTGEWSLDEPSPDPLRQEVFATLRWLAEHPRLVTLGLWAKRSDDRRILFRSGDPAMALGRAYGLLVAWALPFLEPQDELLMQPGLRSEEANILARQRAMTTANQAGATDSRREGYFRGTLSALEEEVQTAQDSWQGGKLAGFKAGTLDHLREGCPPLRQAWLPNGALNATADLGAGLLRLACQQDLSLFRLRRDAGWRNVAFLSLTEVTA